MKQTTKRYLMSALITFLGGFLSVIAFKIDDLSMSCLKDGTLIGLIFVAFRTGLKGLIELFLLSTNQK